MEPTDEERQRGWSGWSGAVFGLKLGQEEAERIRERVRAIHRRVLDDWYGKGHICTYCGIPYPCLTILALDDPEAQP